MFVFRNYTVENLFPDGMSFSGYGDISTIPADEHELLWFYQVPINFDTAKQVDEVNSITQKLQLVAGTLSGQTLYILSLEDMFEPHYVDTDNALADAIAGFNDTAMQLASEHSNIRFIDFGEFLAKYPSDQLINWRFYFISQMIVAPAIAKDFFPWFSHRISQIKGQRKKCLVLDLDNTLWGGILGEDGIDGIRIGGDYPGNAFLYFQEGLEQLAKDGVILTVCSKNNEADVLEAWDKNPYIIIKQDKISAYRINWNNKADNIRELAAELNIGLDSMVFVDDNPTERELIRQQLPMVEVPEFPKKPYDLMPFYQKLTDTYFRAYTLTDEDRKKTAQYKSNAQRAAAQRQFTDMASYIRSLNIEMDVLKADRFNIARIAQMTQKTNQFNLTTHRYTEADIQAFVDRGDIVYCLSVKDRFGDSGITGAIIANIDGDCATIDTLLLSCRILGKDIEVAFVKTVLNLLYARGVSNLSATYIPTAKNAMVTGFYDNLGFEEVTNHDGVKEYTLHFDRPFEISNSYTINVK